MRTLFIIVALFSVLAFSLFGCCGAFPLPNNNSTLNNNSTNRATGLNVTVFDSNTGVAIEGVTILLIGDEINYTGITDANGNYIFTDIRKGRYGEIFRKDGYSNLTSEDNFTKPGVYTMSPQLAPSCYFSGPFNVSDHYKVTVGFNGTVHQGTLTFSFPYPDGSYYDISPTPDGRISILNIHYVGNNRVLNWTIGANYGDDVPYRVHITYNGTLTTKKFENKKMSISQAAREQPNYLGQTYDPFVDKIMIDPHDSNVKAVAQRVKKDATSNDTWTVARELFKWLKTDTIYNDTHPETHVYQTAPDVLRSRQGICVELSSLYISLLRAAGIPARQVLGYAMDGPADYQREPLRGYLAHQWVEFYDGEWVPVEVSGAPSVDIEYNLNAYFGIASLDHVGIFIDEGTYNSSLSFMPIAFSYTPDFKQDSDYSSHYEYTFFNPMYVKTCQNGSITLVKTKDG